MPLKDVTGEKFGRLTALNRAFIKNNESHWLFLCDCGKRKTVRLGDLEKTRSCGCLRSEILTRRLTKHGMAGQRFYSIFLDMTRRCEDKKCLSYKNYGLRGIKNLWKSFEDFKKDMYEPYLKHVKKFGKKQTSIDRINVNGHYCKGNCRWATWKEQMRNTRKNHLITFKGKTMSLSAWSEKLKMNDNTLYNRVNVYKWTVEESLTTPVK